MLGELVHHQLRRTENDAVVQVHEVNDPAQRLQLRAAVHLVIHLINVRHRELLILDAHIHRILRELRDHLLDRWRERRAEKHRLPVRLRLGKNRDHVVAETHVQHPVRLIEHDHADICHRERFALDVIHHAPRRADDDLRAVLQPGELPLVARAAIDRQLLHAALELREPRHFLRNLHREFACRAKHEHLRRAHRHIHALDRGKREGRRLSRARLRLADDIAPGQQHRDRLALDRRRKLVADVRDRLESFRRQAEFGEWFFLHPRTLPAHQ